MRGIPIPSLILARYDDAQTGQKTAAKENVSELAPQDGDYFLIDGQQRARALLAASERICVRDQNGGDLLTQRLWLDLNWPHVPSGPTNVPTETLDGWGMRFGFFLCTQALPWGHDRSRTGRPSATKVRAARKLLFDSELYSPFSSAGSKKGCFDFELPLKHTWPVEARCPVPFKNILEHSQNNGPHDEESWKQFLKSQWDEFKQSLCHQNENVAKCTFSEPDATTLQRVASQLDVALPKLKNRCLGSIVADLPDDELLPAFQRINRNGSLVTNEELFFAAVKKEEPACDALARKSGNYFPPLDVVRGAVIHVTQPVPTQGTSGQKRTQKHTPPIDLSPPNLRALAKVAGSKKDLSTKLQNALKDQPGSFATALVSITKILRYDNQFGQNDPGIPAVMFPNLSVTSWLPPLVWLIQRQTQHSNNEPFSVASAERESLLRYVLTNHFFADWDPDAAPMLRDLLDYVLDEAKASRPFPEVWAIRDRLAVYEKKDSGGAPAWLRKVDDENAPNGPLVLPLTPAEWTTFHRRWLARNSGWLPDSSNYGGLLPSGLAIDLLMWSQRQAIDEWFSPHATVIAQMAKIGKPWDADHIVPSSFVDGRSATCLDNTALSSANFPGTLPELTGFKAEWQNIKTIANRFGNRRLWPMGFNRGDGNASPYDKLDNDWLGQHFDWEVLSQWAKQTRTKNDLLKASRIDAGEIQYWNSTPNKGNGTKPTWNQQSCEAFLRATVSDPCGRERAIYKELFDVLAPGLKCHDDWKQGASGDRFPPPA